MSLTEMLLFWIAVSLSYAPVVLVCQWASKKLDDFWQEVPTQDDAASVQSTHRNLKGRDMTVITLPVGTRVRSYDFMGSNDCYVEGVIEGYGGGVFPSDSHYRIAVDRRVWEGVEEPVTDRERKVYPAIRGMFGQIMVKKIG